MIDDRGAVKLDLQLTAFNQTYELKYEAVFNIVWY